MKSNLDKYKNDIQKLINFGGILQNSMQYECYPDDFTKQIKEAIKDKAQLDDVMNNLVSFHSEYQGWYSEALALIKLMLPDRLNDFIKFYEKPKTRKEVLYDTYVIEDYLKGLKVTRSGEIKVGPHAAIPQFQQQLYILKSVQKRFESSLFDIKQLVQADLFDSELGAATELAKNKFNRAAGALAGVVLEKHLRQVCDNHNLSLAKKNPTINDYNELLKQNDIIDIPQWRFIQHLADIRNLCDHDKKKEPTPQEIEDLINGVEKVTKTLF